MKNYKKGMASTELLLVAVLVAVVAMLAYMFAGGTMSSAGSGGVDTEKDGVWGDSKYASIHLKGLDAINESVTNASYKVYLGEAKTADTTGYTGATEATLDSTVGKDEDFRVIFGGTNAYYVETMEKADKPIIRLTGNIPYYATPALVELEYKSTYADLKAAENLTVSLAAGEGVDVIVRFKGDALKYYGLDGKFAFCVNDDNYTLDEISITEESELASIPKTMKAFEYCFEINGDISDNQQVERTLHLVADTDPSNLTLTFGMADYANYIDDDSHLQKGYVDEDGADVGLAAPSLTGALKIS